MMSAEGLYLEGYSETNGISREEMTPEPGQMCGPYEILGRLGGDGMGLVFRAWDERLHREVAIKLVRDGYRVPGTRERFLQEARAALYVSRAGAPPGHWPMTRKATVTQVEVNLRAVRIIEGQYSWPEATSIRSPRRRLCAFRRRFPWPPEAAKGRSSINGSAPHLFRNSLRFIQTSDVGRRGNRHRLPPS